MKIFIENFYETLNARLPPQQAPNTPQNLSKRVSEHPRRFNFSRKKNREKKLTTN